MSLFTTSTRTHRSGYDVGAPHPRRRRLLSTALAAIVLAVQFVLVATTLPLRDVWTDLPLFHIDGAFHWYHMKLGANLAAAREVVGYDPFFAAGHVNGVHYNFSARVPTALAALISPGVNEIRLYKLYVLLAATLAPIAIFGAALVLRLTRFEALLAGLLGIAMWWVSYLRWYDTAGMVGFVTACYGGVLFVALLIRHLEGAWGTGATIGLGLFGALGFFWHSLFPVPVAVATLAFLAVNAARLHWPRVLGSCAIIAALSILPNLFWLYATIRFSEASAPNDVQMLVDGSLIGRELLGVLRDHAHGSKVYPLLFVATLGACLGRDVQRSRHHWFSLLAGAAALQVLAYLGAAIPRVGLIQPNRMAPAGYLLLCIPAARGLAVIAKGALERGALLTRAAFALAGAFVLTVGSVVAWEVWREVTPGPQGRYGAAPPEVRPLGDTSTWAMAWLLTRTTPDARVYFETSLARIHDRAHMAGYLAYNTQREFIGGPYPWMHFANAWDGVAFRNPITDLPAVKMADYLSLYNIGAILVHSTAAKQFFDKMPGVRLDAEHGALRAYIVDGNHSYFIKGSGRVESRGHNTVVFADVTGSEVILKYHYVPGLVTDPPTAIGGVRQLDDPTPFVRIVDPPGRFRLRLAAP